MPARDKSYAYSITTPCPKCPFRTDVKPYLTRPRAQEIARALERSEFPCHLTTDHDALSGDEGDQLRNTTNEIHCAGALIVLEKMEQPSQMMRICERLGIYDPRKLDMSAPVFESLDDMIEAQPRGRGRRR